MTCIGIKNWSLVFDLAIVFETIKVVLLGRDRGEKTTNDQKSCASGHWSSTQTGVIMKLKLIIVSMYRDDASLFCRRHD
jgi:hypothetical protein